LFGLIKRARKYGLGITTISQDIEDFIRSPYGKPIVSNSSLQILLKQSVTSIKSLNQLL
jgi:type IV secretory pathway VirB4 component